MTEATRFVPLRGVGMILAAFAVLGIWRWAVAHMTLLGSFLWHGTLGAFALVLNTTSCEIVRDVRRGLSWLLVLWLLGWAAALLPERGGSFGTLLRSLPGVVLRAAFGAARPLPRLLGRVLYKLIWRSERTTANTPTKGGPPKQG